ncbi:cyclin-dependent kinase 14-like [Macrobrachium rosenbergii]|uniref:cyclin-dependent kinase 14-like n=1 Tax=Macrobrachium rosenbergii TaxID=79674 RepID=UPI0034D64EB2
MYCSLLVFITCEVVIACVLLCQNQANFSMKLKTVKLEKCIAEFTSSLSSLSGKSRKIVDKATTLQVPLVSLASVNFEKLETLGSGSYGTCYRHKFPDMEETVCIKVFKHNPVRGPGWRAMLLEVEALKSIDGISGTPRLIAVSPVAPSAIIMSDVGTLTFLEWLKTNPGTPREAILALKKISTIVQQIHARRLSHNDLHERNVIIDERNEPSVVDFGNMLPFGVRTWRTLFFTKMIFRQMIGIEAVGASNDIMRFGKLLRDSLSFFSLDASIENDLKKLARDCIRLKVGSIGDVVTKLEVILWRYDEQLRSTFRQGE